MNIARRVSGVSWLLVVMAACGSKEAAKQPPKEAAPAPVAPAPTAPAPAAAPVAAPAAPAAVDPACDPLSHYSVELTWAKGKKACSLGPQRLKKLGFNLFEFANKGGYGASLDDGVMTDSSSPYYETELENVKADGCKLTVKLSQPPSHQTWAFLTLEIDHTGGKLTGTASYDQSEEGETCQTTATITGKMDEAVGGPDIEDNEDSED